MKRFIFSLLALAIALTACKKHRTSDESEAKLPEPKLGELIVDGLSRPISLPTSKNIVNISYLYEGTFYFTIPNWFTGENLEIYLSKVHNGEMVDLSKVDPVAGTENIAYNILYADEVLANGVNTGSAKYCEKGSYLIVRTFDGWYYEIELSLLTTEGKSVSCKYKGALVPRMYDPNNPLVYYDGVFYTPSVFKFENSSGKNTLIVSIDGGLEFKVVIDEAYNDNDIDISEYAPNHVFYSIQEKDGVSFPYKTLVYDDLHDSEGGYAGSTLWVKIVGSKVSANVSLLTDDHILAFDFYSRQVSQ